jgi:hypothetical protein
VFLSVVGVWFLFRDRVGWAEAAVAGLLLIAAALTKQSFYVMPLAGGLWLCWTRRRLRDIAAYGITCGALLLAFVIALRHFGVWDAFIVQTTGSTRIQDAVNAGIRVYFVLGGLYLGCCLVGLVVVLLAERLRVKFVPGKLLTVFLSVFVLLNLIFLFRNIAYGDTEFIKESILGYSQAMFLLALLFAVGELRKDRTRGSSFVVLLVIAWCASLSWGYATPLFFSAPLIYGVVRLSRRIGDVLLSDSGLVAVMLCVGIVIFSLADLYPYRDLDGRLHDHRDLGDLVPRLEGIVGGDRDWSRLAEFVRS